MPAPLLAPQPISCARHGGLSLHRSGLRRPWHALETPRGTAAVIAMGWHSTGLCRHCHSFFCTQFSHGQPNLDKHPFGGLSACSVELPGARQPSWCAVPVSPDRQPLKRCSISCEEPLLLMLAALVLGQTGFHPTLCLGEPAVSIAGGFLCQLCGLVLATAFTRAKDPPVSLREPSPLFHRGDTAGSTGGIPPVPQGGYRRFHMT
jgi:hypothetical protein